LRGHYSVYHSRRKKTFWLFGEKGSQEAESAGARATTQHKSRGQFSPRVLCVASVLAKSGAPRYQARIGS
jgi:hypothetical protein